MSPPMNAGSARAVPTKPLDPEPKPERCEYKSALVSAVRDAMATTGEDAGIKKLVAKVKAQHPELLAGGRKVGAKEVREAMQLADQEAAEEAEVAEIVQRTEDILAARAAGGDPAAAAVAQAQRLGAGGGLGLEGFPTGAESYNGLYRRAGRELYNGWPRYENQLSGRHLFCMPSDDFPAEWHVHTDFMPSGCLGSIGYIQSRGGVVPVGAQTWSVVPAHHKNGSKRDDLAVTVQELLVR